MSVKIRCSFRGRIGFKSMICLCFMILRLPIITAFVLHSSNFEGIQKLKKSKLQSNISQDSETLSKILTLKIIQTELGEDALCERSLRNGLSAEEANKMLEKYGENVIETERKTNVMDLWLAQFDERLVQILLFVALISCISSIPAVFNSVGSQNDVVLQSFIEPSVIILILVINSGVGVWQQLSAIQSLDALKTLLPKLATVLRRDEEGRSNVIANFDASKLVPGDIVRLKVGDVIPADACITSLMSSSILTIDESTLTGESIPVHKLPIHEANCDLSEKVLDNSDRRDPLLEDGRLYSGTTVTKGAAEAVVMKTGLRTKMGSLRSAVENVEIEATPLNRQLNKFGDNLALGIAIICAIVWLVSIPRFDDPFFPTKMSGAFYYAKVGVALGVAAIPEGLPAVITLVLALGTRRLAEQNVIVRNLESVETLGCVSIIATDKTGTLTTNQMTVVSLVMIEKIGKSLEVVEHEVEGTSYYPFGNVFGVEKKEAKKYPDGAVSDIMAVSFGCNDSKLIDAKDGCSIIGDPTEGALLTCAEKLGVQEAAGMQVEKNRQEWNDLWERYITLDFDRKRKSMSTFCRHKNTGAERLLVKGAPDLLLKRCSFLKGRDGTIAKLSLEMRNNIENMISELGSRPLRCLLLATKEVSHDQYKDELKIAEEFVSIESGLTMVGLVGIKDPPRSDAKESISLCKHAGIRVMMMTGDAKDTATAIAKELDMLPCGPNEISHVFEGKDFFSLSKEDQRSLLSNGNLVLARTEATDKQLLLKMLQSLGEVPAMTGDGVNDAPALRQASIGVAMGSGTEIAKEAADMILVDDSFGTIVRGVQEGRCIYANIQAFINFLISCNIGEVLAVFFATVLGYPSMLSAIQLLWVNLITDGPPAIALGWNPPDDTIMRKLPRSRNEDIVTSWVLTRYLVIGLYIGGATVGIFTSHFLSHGINFDMLTNWTMCLEHARNSAICDAFSEDALALPRTLALTTLIVTEMLKALSSVSNDESLLQVGPQKNPYLLVGVSVPFAIHLGIMYSSNLGFQAVSESFGITPLTIENWESVLFWSLPILLLEEVLKALSRSQNSFDN